MFLRTSSNNILILNILMIVLKSIKRGFKYILKETLTKLDILSFVAIKKVSKTI